MRTNSVKKFTQTLSIVASSMTLLSAGGTAAHAGTLDYILKRGVFEVCASPDAMPFSELPRSGSPVGLHIDLGEALARELGVSAKFSFVHFRFEARQTGCDAFMSVGVLTNQEKGPIKKTVPLLQYETLMVSKPDRKIVRVEDLDGLKVATQQGTLAHVTLLKRPVDVRISLLREDDMLNAIDRGEIDVGIVTNFGYYWYLKNNPSKTFEVQPASMVQSPTGYPMAIGLRKADDKTVDATNAAIARLQASGELVTILKKYGLETAAAMP
jgi:polar amino acid transport system substrate-binding protein